MKETLLAEVRIQANTLVNQTQSAMVPEQNMVWDYVQMQIKNMQKIIESLQRTVQQLNNENEELKEQLKDEKHAKSFSSTKKTENDKYVPNWEEEEKSDWMSPNIRRRRHRPRQSRKIDQMRGMLKHRNHHQ